MTRAEFRRFQLLAMCLGTKAATLFKYEYADYGDHIHVSIDKAYALKFAERDLHMSAKRISVAKPERK